MTAAMRIRDGVVEARGRLSLLPWSRAVLVVATLHAIVHVSFRRGAEREVVKAREPKAFAEVFVEVVQGGQVRSERGNFLARRCAEELLITGIDQVCDFVAGQKAGVAERDFAIAQILDRG